MIELLLERTGYSVWIDLLFFGYFFLSAHSVWFYQRVDLLYFGHCPYLEADSTVVQTLGIFGVTGYRNHHRIRTVCVIRY